MRFLICNALPRFVFVQYLPRVFHVEHLAAMCAPPCRASQAIQQVFDVLRRSCSPCDGIERLCASFICETLPQFVSAQYLPRVFHVEHCCACTFSPLQDAPGNTVVKILPAMRASSFCRHDPIAPMLAQDRAIATACRPAYSRTMLAVAFYEEHRRRMLSVCIHEPPCMRGKAGIRTARCPGGEISFVFKRATALAMQNAIFSADSCCCRNANLPFRDFEAIFSAHACTCAEAASVSARTRGAFTNCVANFRLSGHMRRIARLCTNFYYYICMFHASHAPQQIVSRETVRADKFLLRRTPCAR